MKSIFLLCIFLFPATLFCQTEFANEEVLLRVEELSPQSISALIDLDEFPDIVTVVRWGENQRVVWQKNLQNGSFSDEIIITTDIFQPFRIMAGDTDTDGNTDLLVVDINHDVHLFNNDGSGNFTFREKFWISNFNNAFFLDIDNDTVEELVYWSYADGQLGYYTFDGAGNSLFSKTMVRGLPGVVEVELYDLDFDDDLDIIVITNEPDKVSLLENLGDNTYASPKELNYNGNHPRSVEVAKMDSDDYYDIIVASSVSSEIAIYYLDDQFNTLKESTVANLNGASNIKVVDLDMDGDHDIVAGQATGTSRIYYNIDGHTFIEDSSISVFETGVNYGVWSINAIDIDADCDIDLVIKEANLFLFRNELWSEPMDADDDGFNCLNDCNDNDALINPGATEIHGNDIDENCDGSTLVSSNNELSTAPFFLYPNPTSDFLIFKTEDLSNLHIELYNNYGTYISGHHQQEKINIAHLPSGNYIIKIIDLSTKKFRYQKIVKI